MPANTAAVALRWKRLLALGIVLLPAGSGLFAQEVLQSPAQPPTRTPSTFPTPSQLRDNMRDRLNPPANIALPGGATVEPVAPGDIPGSVSNILQHPLPDSAPTLTPSPAQPPAAVPLDQDPNAAFMEENEPLLLSDVIASTFRAFPQIEIARRQGQVASGELRSAWGEYDLKLDYYSLNQPLGYYQTYRNGISMARQTWWGGYASAGYRIGRGYYEPWYKERQTDDAGEFKVALQQPLLQGRAIDPLRVQLFQSTLRQQAVGPEIQFQLLVASRDAAFAYWLWVEQGNVLKAQERLLKLAEQRAGQFEEAFRAGIATEFTVSLNKQEILSRQIKVNDTRMKFRDSSYKLSIFLRDEAGQPLLAPEVWLPADFPEVREIQLGNYDQDYRNALNARPELRLLDIESQEVRWDLQLARNQTLPNVDFTIQAGKDIGELATSTGDKRPFELETGIVGNTPVQRNKAFGKIQSTNAKLMQIAIKSEFQRNKINTELLTARNQVEVAQMNVKIARELLAETQKVLGFFRLAVTSGDFDLQLFLQQEVKVTEAEVKLFEAERTYFHAIAALQATLGLDPLDQSTLLATPIATPANAP